MFTLGKYVKDKITPRRLRWDIAPNDGLVDKDLEDKWFSFFNHRKNIIGNVNNKEREKIETIRRSKLMLLNPNQVP